MASPFPGMDPYLEPHWLDIHAKLIAFSGEALNTHLPDELVARSEEHVGIDANDEDRDALIGYRPDVRVFASRSGEAILWPSEGGLAIAAPMKLVVDVDPVPDRYITIIRPGDERLITVIEFVSPSNKIGAGLARYLKRRAEFVDAGVHVVEIDLTRRGDWRALMRPHVLPADGESTYRITVRPAEPGPQAAYVYPIALGQPLPAVSIPLRPGDPEVKLALQPLIDRAYDGGRYARTLKYDRPLDPPLTDAEAAVAARVIAAAARPG